MLTWLLRLCRFRCRHPHTYRERREGQLMLVCDTCGRAFPVAVSDRDKAKRLRARLKKSRVHQKPPAPVIGIVRREQSR